MAAIGTDRKKRMFVEAYDPENPAIAMRLAGYSGTDSYLKQKAKKFLEDPHMLKAIEERNRYIESTDKVIATRTERQAFWTSLMRNDVDALNIKPEYDANGLPKKLENLPLAQRMKASELLGKSETDFIDRVDINHNITITDVIQQSYLDDGSSIEDIEAQYTRLQNKLEEIEEAKEEEVKPPTLESFI